MKVYQITREEAPAPVKVPPIPKLPDISALTPEAPIEPSPGEKISMNKDGTISYSGAFGTFIFDKTGKALKYSTPNFSGFGQTVDLTTQSTTQSYNQGPLSVQQTTDASGKQTGSDAQYDLGTTAVRQQTDATGNKTNTVTPTTTEELDRMLTIAGLK